MQCSRQADLSAETLKLWSFDSTRRIESEVLLFAAIRNNNVSQDGGLKMQNMIDAALIRSFRYLRNGPDPLCPGPLSRI